MSTPILSLPIREEPDVVAVRQRARHVAEALGFDGIEQTRIATAVSEVARNAFMYAGGGQATYLLTGDTAPQVLVVRISDHGRGIANLPAILAGEYRSSTGMGLGLTGARRLVDRFAVESSPSGTTVTLMKLLPARSRFYAGAELGAVVSALTARRPDGAVDEVRQQNRELLSALSDLRSRQEELERVNRELEDTNRGVVALYAELDERADHLRRADEVKTKFLSNMTHEFRTPVNSILALTRLLGERLQTDEADKNELFYIRKSAQQLSDLVDDLLDIAKVEAGKIDVRPAPFEVQGLFGALRGMLRPLLVGQSVQLLFDDPVGLPPLYSDETKISQILRNFVSNALKYTDNGEVRVKAVQRDNEVEFSVADTGIGIPSDDIPRIFDEFVQIDNPLQRRVKGTGLGLPLSRRLAELLGGRISVSSVLGEGSTFTLRVPLMHRSPTLVQVAESVDGRIPVLVVEDSDDDLLIYHRILSNSPFHLITARSADLALTVASTATLAAIILDIGLYGHDSWDLLIRFRRDVATANIPLVVVSAVNDRRKALSLGAHAFGLKPVERSWLLDTLAALVGRTPAIRVLVIDDEEAFRFIIREILCAPLYEMAEAESGRSGMDMVDAFAPDVILLDIELPDLNGYEVLAHLKNSSQAAIPVVVITSHSAAMHAHSRLERAAAVISKSTLSRDLVRTAIRDAAAVSAHGE